MTTEEHDLIDEDEMLNLKRRLGSTWKVFFSEFGSLLPIQQKAIPIILEGKNAMIISSTASGKTEAVVAPICENLIRENGPRFNQKGLLALYISPTRALVNDLYKRLDQKLQRLWMCSATKTSDRGDFKIDDPQTFLFTTPESADSLLSRHPQVFQNLQYIILDELHLVDNTYRGDQLRILINRIKDASSSRERTRFYAMSATIKNPQAVAARYFTPFEVVKAQGSREIEFESVDNSSNDLGLLKIKAIFYDRDFKKAIFFCNSRQETVRICNLLKNLYDRSDRIFEHHSSVSKQIRRHAEQEMAKATNVLSICVATASLEVGIDIGDIDAIVLVSPPPTISSFLQRIGRGNRRLNKTICFGLYRDIEEKSEFLRMVELAKQGQIETVSYSPDVSVAIQQLFSLLFQSKNAAHSLTVSRDIVYQYFRILELEREKADLIVDHLTDEGWIKEYLGKILPTQKLLDFDDNLGTRGKINSNIPGSEEFKVVDESGKEIGEISLIDSMSERFLLGGYKWQIINVRGNTIKARRISGDAYVPAFGSKFNIGYYYPWLPPQLQRR